MKTRRNGRSGGKLAHAAAARALLMDIVESSDDAIFSRKLDGTVSSWNRAAERIFGYRAEEIIGRSSVVLLPPDRPDEIQMLMQRIRSGERVAHFETVRLRKGGRPRTVLLSVSPIRDGRRRVGGALTIARDITEQRRLEAELLEVSEHERERIGRDLHDGLGQQLAGLELLCQTLSQKLGVRSQAERRTAEVLVTQIQQAREQTRALARGLVPVMARPEGLMQALDEFAATTRKLLRVRCGFSCEEPVLIDDHSVAVHLYRIAQEAVSNAIRHGKARRVEVALAQHADKLAVRVCDNGIGLQPGFKQTTGMGLRIMRYRSRMAGGTLGLEPALPRGTVLTCTVPLPRPDREVVKEHDG